MPKFRVVTDSTVDVTPEEIEKYGITIVPLSVLIDLLYRSIFMLG